MKAILDAKDFNKAIAAVKSLISNNSNKPAMQYIRLEFGNGQMKAVACDGFTLATEVCSCMQCDTFIAYVKPFKLPNCLCIVSLYEKCDKLMFDCDGVIFGFKQPESDYFDYQSVIKTLEEKPILFKQSFNAEYLLAVIKSAKLGINVSTREPITLEFRGQLEPVIISTHKRECIKLALPVRCKD